MRVVDLEDETTTLSLLVEVVERDEEVLIARDGRPVALVTAVHQKARRALGQWRGRLHRAADFDAPLSEEDLQAWEASAR